MLVQVLRYAAVVEWTPERMRLFREVGLCQSQEGFARTLGFAKRTIGNAERGNHPPSLALRRALDDALANASEAQRDRFRAAVTAHDTATPRVPVVVPGRPVATLDGLRGAVLGFPSAAPVTQPAANLMTATVQVHRLYQMADYDAAAQLLSAVLTGLQNSGTDDSHDDCLVGTLTARHAAAVAYLAAAKLATKLGDVGLASVTADRALLAAKECEHPALVGAATYQVACALLLTGELADAAQIVVAGAENIASISATTRLNCRPEEALSVQGALLLLLGIIAARQGDDSIAQKALRDAGQLADQLRGDSNWLWTAFGSTNVAIHQLSVQSRLGNAQKAAQIAEVIDTDSLPVVLRGRRAQIHLELGWAAAGQADDAIAVLHLLEAERVAEQAVSRNASARALLSALLARERRGVTPGLRELASRAGLLP
ncbi:MAG TPA: helix-turn-helix transcriptional regulator [Pseudonocardiaceae bacterium]|jgi:DNA-binding XRE family transcriptional regulator|nr:helix-turn-helix transcriptional regulator [Pseudonocardiaceae bacterium]